ncbi:hypothetical protein F4808DRAFT_29601 [Astrocystis sublimbata]|nr:hypothetical protein F4808DRAFT_29601 [Astrocystis sublimbata]
MRRLRSNGKRRRPRHEEADDAIATAQARDQNSLLPASKRGRTRRQLLSSAPARHETQSYRDLVRTDTGEEIHPDSRVVNWLQDIVPGSRESEGEEDHDSAGISNGTTSKNRRDKVPDSQSRSMPPLPTPPLTSSSSRRGRFAKVEKPVAKRPARGRGHVSDTRSIASSGVSTNSISQSSSPSGRNRIRDPRYNHNVLQRSIETINPLLTPEPAFVTAHLAMITAPHAGPGLSATFINEFRTALYGMRGGSRSDEAGFSELFAAMLPSTRVRRSGDVDGEGEGGDEDGDLAYLGHETGLAHDILTPISRYIVPPEVVAPKPDWVYGYSDEVGDGAFTQLQLDTQDQLRDIYGNPLAVVNTHGLRFPFFVVEMKGRGDKHWVVANQIAGGCLACLSSVRAINAALREKVKQVQKAAASSPAAPPAEKEKGEEEEGGGGVEEEEKEDTATSLAIDTVVYGLTADTTAASLYVAWYSRDADSENGKCKTFFVDAFSLHRAGELQKLWACIRQILDWGMGARLRRIRGALDFLGLG